MQTNQATKIYDFESFRQEQDLVRRTRQLEKENEMLAMFLAESAREVDELRWRLEKEA